MKTRVRILLTITIVLATIVASFSQQYPVFTQYYFNELVINPGYAGAHVQYSATAMYRNQWVNFPGAPKTFNFSNHVALLKNKIGVGFMVNHDEIGSYKNDHIYLYYAYKLHFGKATLSMGLQAGINVLGADYSTLDLQTDTGVDPSFNNILGSVKPNFGVGFYYSKKNWFLGFSIPFIMNNEVQNGVESLLGAVQERRYYFFRGGTVFPIAKDVKLNPSFLVRTQEGQPLSLDINTAFIFYDIFSIGASYRLGDAFMTFIDLKLSEKIHFGYSYDWTQSDLKRASAGTHEFMITFRSIIRGIHKNPECPQYYDYK